MLDAVLLVSDGDMKRNCNTLRPRRVPTSALKKTATRMPERFSRSCFTWTEKSEERRDRDSGCCASGGGVCGGRAAVW